MKCRLYTSERQKCCR